VHAELIRKIATHYGTGEDRVAVGNGTDELIVMLALAYRKDPRPVVLTGQTFLSYPKALRAVGVSYFERPLVDHRVSAASLAEAFDQGAGLAFVCNPHNPTGSLLDAASIRELVAAAQGNNAVLVLDEAYAEFADGFTSGLPWAGEEHGVVVMRTLSKAYGLAALRVGYLVGDLRIVSRITELQDAFPFHVNKLAQLAACPALDDQEFINRTRITNIAAREALCLGLDELGVTWFPSHTNFVLVKLPEVASRVAGALRDNGILVRDASDMGFSGHLRISVGLPGEMPAFLRHLKAALNDV
jgi:histidinol-phosphate aminotransferase